ncbi:MAG: exosortase/archaeosortase family protein [Candidatus Brockarchaeota archaeon]|nr:exosortase/archaeosortase family protein [Candidatus Brockarchaeota archaeon]
MQESLGRVNAQARLGRAAAIASLFLVSSLPLFSDVYFRALALATDFDLLSSSGAYPLAMLLFLLIWLLVNRGEIAHALSKDASGFRTTWYSALGLTLLGASLAGRALLKGPGLFALQLFLLLCFLQGCASIAFPETSKITLKAFAIYVASASIPFTASTFFDRPISLGFAGAVVPLLKAVGYPVERSASTILLELPSGKVSSLVIDSACAGTASYGIFLLLDGLMALDLRAERRKAALFTLAGLATIFVLNLLRVAAIVHAVYNYGELAGHHVHLYLGYVLFTSFYLAYALLFARSFGQRHP